MSIFRRMFQPPSPEVFANVETGCASLYSNTTIDTLAFFSEGVEKCKRLVASDDVTIDMSTSGDADYALVYFLRREVGTDPTTVISQAQKKRLWEKILADAPTHQYARAILSRYKRGEEKAKAEGILTKLRQKGCVFKDFSFELLEHIQCKAGRRVVTIVEFPVERFVKGAISYETVYSTAASMGLRSCPSDTAVQICLQTTPKGHKGYIVSGTVPNDIGDPFEFVISPADNTHWTISSRFFYNLIPRQSVFLFCRH